MEIITNKIKTESEQLLLGNGGLEMLDVLKAYDAGTLDNINRKKSIEITSKELVEKFGFQIITTEELFDFIHTYGLELIQSRDFNDDIPIEILNELSEFIKKIPVSERISFTHYFLLDHSGKVIAGLSFVEVYKSGVCLFMLHSKKILSKRVGIIKKL
jgi:hypothetical protein